jgi:hypothetical protein
MISRYAQALFVLAVVATGCSSSPQTISPTTTTQSATETGSASEFGPRFTAAVSRYGCTPEDEPFRCLEIHLRSVLDRDGIDAAIAEVEDVYEVVSPEPFACHPLTHSLGRHYVLTGGPDAMADAVAAPSTCESGFIHGAFEALGHIGDPRSVALVVQGVCAAATGKVRDDCTHSAGHTFAIAFPKDLRAALSGCAVFDPESENCARGVLMAYAIGSPPFTDAHSHTWDSSWGWVGFDGTNAEGACVQVREDWQPACWEFVWNAYYLHTDELSVSGYLKSCPSELGKPRTLCMQNGGRLIVSLQEQPDPEGALKECTDSVASASDCVYGVAYYFANTDAYLGVMPADRDVVCELASRLGWEDDLVQSCLAGDTAGYSSVSR